MVRKAAIKDVPAIQEIINQFARDDQMLPRSRNELYEHIRDFWVVEERRKIVGCAALHVAWDDLAELKSVAVLRSRHGRGLGTKLVEACIREARALGVRRLFVLTYHPQYFRKFGFSRIRHSALPHKIWAECIHCPKFPDCKEVAMLKKLRRS